MTAIYLVEGSWSDQEAQGYWVARAFTTLVAAEQYRAACQQYADDYCEDFWGWFVAEFGTPPQGRNRGAFRWAATPGDG